MAELIVPPLEGDGVWPSLGQDVGDWQEAMLAFGPGDLLGKRYILDDEDRAILERAYQVHPPDHAGRCRFEPATGGWRCSRGAGQCGRRRFGTVVLMKRKGTKKSEGLAAFASAELGDDAPVRCDGFRREHSQWIPVGRPVVSPFVFILAFAKEQAEDTSWDAMRAMIEGGPGADHFAVWQERIQRRDGTGEAKALATAPDSRDGGKTTFQGKEEGHRWTLPRQKEAHQTTVGNLSKRPIADPWELHATTAYAPGEGSVAEDLHDAARKLVGAAAKRSPMFFFYRWADKSIRIRNEDGSYDPDGLRRAIVAASGPAVARWSDVDDIMARQFLGPTADPAYAERVWLNRVVPHAQLAFDAESWKRNARPKHVIAPGAKVAAGFDGSRGSRDPRRSPDHTGLIVTELETGWQTKFGHWDPTKFEGGQIPRAEVDIAVDDMYDRFEVIRFYPDPPDWDSEVAAWRAKYGDSVQEWFTWRDRPIGFACANYAKAIVSGQVIHDGDPEFAAQIGHAHKRLLNVRDGDGNRLWTIQKERDGSPLKIDLGMGGVLSWEARSDAIAAGALHVQAEPAGPAFASF